MSGCRSRWYWPKGFTTVRIKWQKQRTASAGEGEEHKNNALYEALRGQKTPLRRMRTVSTALFPQVVLGHDATLVREEEKRSFFYEPSLLDSPSSCVCVWPVVNRMWTLLGALPEMFPSSGYWFDVGYLFRRRFTPARNFSSFHVKVDLRSWSALWTIFPTRTWYSAVTFVSVLPREWVWRKLDFFCAQSHLASGHYFYGSRGLQQSPVQFLSCLRSTCFGFPERWLQEHIHHSVQCLVRHRMHFLLQSRRLFKVETASPHVSVFWPVETCLSLSQSLFGQVSHIVSREVGLGILCAICTR